MYFLYSLLAAFALVASAPWVAWQALRHGKYRHRWQERFGALPPSLTGAGGPTLWLHAVSVGEVLSAAPLVAAIRRAHPDWRIIVSTTTRTGRDMAEARLGGVAGVFYFPLDFAWVVRKVITHVRPTLVVIVETEIWPNLVRLCRRYRRAAGECPDFRQELSAVPAGAPRARQRAGAVRSAVCPVGRDGAPLA